MTPRTVDDDGTGYSRQVNLAMHQNIPQRTHGKTATASALRSMPWRSMPHRQLPCKRNLTSSTSPHVSTPFLLMSMRLAAMMPSCSKTHKDCHVALSIQP